MTWKLKRTIQCEKCPWRKDVNPHDIPNGYDVDKHKNLIGTISKGAEEDLASIISGEKVCRRVMACHETQDAHCIGWLVNQAGRGNNIPLRISLMSCSNAGKVKVVGEQWETFEETIPKETA